MYPMVVGCIRQCGLIKIRIIITPLFSKTLGVILMLNRQNIVLYNSSQSSISITFCTFARFVICERQIENTDRNPIGRQPIMM